MARSVSILDHFAALSDPRQHWRVVYPPPEILLLVLCAPLSGMEDFVEIRLWGGQRLEFLRRFLHLLALKATAPPPMPMSRVFAEPLPGMTADTHDTTDNDHGRLEHRRHSVGHDVGWLFSDRRTPDEPRFPRLAMIGMVETRIERAGKPGSEPAQSRRTRPSSGPWP